MINPVQSGLLGWTWHGGHTRTRPCYLPWWRASVFPGPDGRTSPRHPGSRWWSSLSPPLSLLRYTSWTPSNNNITFSRSTPVLYLTELLDGIVEIHHCVARLEVAAANVTGPEPSLPPCLDIVEAELVASIALAPGYTWHYLGVILTFYLEIGFKIKYKDYLSQSLFH